jgi:hypothetical protein
MHHCDRSPLYKSVGLLSLVLATGLLGGCANASPNVNTGDASSGQPGVQASALASAAYGDQVDFEQSDDDTSELDALVSSANASLPYYMNVSGTDYSYVQSQPQDPTLDEILQSYTSATGLAHATVVGAATRAELDSYLHTYHLDGAVAAAQDAVGATDFQIGLVTTEGLIAPGAHEWVRYYALYFPNVNRFVVLVLDAKEV